MFSDENPIDSVKDWLSEAADREDDANAMSVATVSPEGRPSTRMVLLKAIDIGFVFYTNLGSKKSRDIELEPRVALCFHWKSIAKQVRIEGVAQTVSEREADEYFGSRERESQLAAWASAQSSVLNDRKDLEDNLENHRLRFEGRSITRPADWSGFRVIPQLIEFWDKRPSRLHDRILYKLKDDGSWDRTLLHP